MQYLFGVDIGGTTVKIGLVSLDGNLLDSFEIKTDTSNNGDNILVSIRDAIYSYLCEKEIEHTDVVKGCVNLGWKTKDIPAEFSQLLDWNPTISCANDANVAALGEMQGCSDSNIKNAVMFTLGTGVGGGIILDGKIVDGVHGAAGELGHLHLDNKHNYQCNCGLKGCLETVASATGVVRLAKEYLNTMPSVLNDLEEISAKAIFDAAKAKDSLALKVVDEVAYYIGYAASIVACIVDPDIFIIGGGVSKAGDILINAIKAKYQEFAFHAVANTPFALATLGNNAGMLGAALLAKQ